MNDTKWDELRLAMYGLGDLRPRWSIEWVEIQVLSADQDVAVPALLREIHLPGHRIETGFRIYGYARDGNAVDFIV